MKQNWIELCDEITEIELSVENEESKQTRIRTIGASKVLEI